MKIWLIVRNSCMNNFCFTLILADKDGNKIILKYIICYNPFSWNLDIQVAATRNTSNNYKTCWKLRIVETTYVLNFLHLPCRSEFVWYLRPPNKFGSREVCVGNTWQRDHTISAILPLDRLGLAAGEVYCLHSTTYIPFEGWRDPPFHVQCPWYCLWW